MLILPLHRPLTRESLPWMVAILIAANLFVFFVLQAGDEAAREEAADYYFESGLGAIERPLYARYVATEGSAGARRELTRADASPEPVRTLTYGALIDLDRRFLARLGAGRGFETPEQEATWRERRPRYDALRAGSFTDRYLLRSSEIDPLRMLSSAFLHGSVGHLIGNLLFLALLGLLVEGALGPWRFLLLYVLGAYGASAAALAWHWGTPAAALGASGAVAALMGAYCVLWGRRKVRFFYWFFVVFDYVRAPAIWLLPVWLGWELYNLLANAHLRIGFDAHAGGLLAGAGCAFALVRLGAVNADYLDAEERDQAARDPLPQALVHLGRMELAQVEHLLRPLTETGCDRPEVWLALYRAARYAGRRDLAQHRANAVLALAPIDAAAAREQSALLEDALAFGLSFPLDTRLALARRLAAAGELAVAERLLSALEAESATAPGLVPAWFALALVSRERGDAAGPRLLRRLAERYPAAPEAAKARFLLSEG